MSSATERSSIIIRDIELISAMQEIESLQKEVWACDDRDLVSIHYTCCDAGCIAREDGVLQDALARLQSALMQTSSLG